MNKTSPEVAAIIDDAFQLFEVEREGIPQDQEVWIYIFQKVFESPPNGYNDPRWDTLFDSHYDGLHALEHAFRVMA